MNFEIAKHYEFSQYKLTYNGFMNPKGNCFGLSVDWLRYNKQYPEKNYLKDKYYKKTSEGFFKDIFKVITGTKFDEVHSENFYNRINYYQASQYKFYDNQYELKSKWKFISTAGETPDSGIILLSSAKASNVIKDIGKSPICGHACAYKITQNSKGFTYKYFDPNFGESISKNFATKEQAFEGLHFKIKADMASKYSSTYKDFIFPKNCEKLVDDIQTCWKQDKAVITGKGIGKNSIKFKEIQEFVKSEYDTVSALRKNLPTLEIESALPQESLTESTHEHFQDYYAS
ncbi:MAG: hypothetical protein J0H68_01640 [Sphingobacteriia bacterium]|nr:hypothetical protein [Sphingobacteriia bacterium]